MEAAVQRLIFQDKILDWVYFSFFPKAEVIRKRSHTEDTSEGFPSASQGTRFELTSGYYAEGDFS